jgi:2-polyprenyl-6-methoxyphenol hydroxylase-like FAD-dependent oxidoreductase
VPATSAVVIGGSLAGMCTARVLSDFVDAVTIIERDAYPSAREFRTGVPQARHVHNLLARGLRGGGQASLDGIRLMPPGAQSINVGVNPQ